MPRHQTETVLRVRLESANHGGFKLVPMIRGRDRDDRSILIQTDRDHPGVASNLGFVSCECGRTDGTVPCAHKTVAEMLSAAYEFLDAHIGDTFDDPGYFTED
jgi:hypothetical protein